MSILKFMPKSPFHPSWAKAFKHAAQSEPEDVAARLRELSRRIEEAKGNEAEIDDILKRTRELRIELEGRNRDRDV